MTPPIPINLAVEDALSEAVLRKTLERANRGFAVGTAFNRGGNGYIRRLIAGFNSAARGTPFLVLTDLDQNECPPSLIGDWLRQPAHPNLLFRVAVREVESWVLGDREAFANFFGVRTELIPDNPDSINDPKQLLVNLVRRSRRRDIRADIVPPNGSTSQVGPNYNGRLAEFVASSWDPSAAVNHSLSFARMWEVLMEFDPLWDVENAQE